MTCVVDILMDRAQAFAVSDVHTENGPMPEMTISPKTQKMLLLVSPENQLWKPLLMGISQNTIANYIGVAHGTIPSWKNGGRISSDTAADIFSETRKKILETRTLKSSDRDDLVKMLDDFVSSYEDDTKGIYDTAEILRMTMEECQKTIDAVIYKRGPVFPRMYYDSRSEAEEYLERYKGIYLVWVKRGPYWLRGVLHVRYVMEMGAGFVIRCKFNFPIIDSDHSDRHWEYDGFLVRKPNRIFWMFDKRQKDRNDLFFFVTGTGKSFRRIEGNGNERGHTLSGQYLTAGQDDHQSVVGDRVFLQRFAYHDINNARRTMTLMQESVIAITDGGECARLSSTLVEFESPATNGEPSEALLMSS